MKNGRAGNTGIRVIVFLGMGTLLFLILMSYGLKQSFKPRENTRVPAAAAQSPFDADRAWADLEHIVGLGPRPSGSEAMTTQQQYILRSLKKAGLETRQQNFDAETPRGTLPMVNIWGVVRGTRPGVIVLSNHYDTKYLPNIDFVGANDGASTTAWMLEMARCFGAERDGRTLWLVFFDGEEAQADWSKTDSLYGSRHMVKTLRETGELATIDALINVDMIGDCYLSISKDGGAPPWLSEIVWNTAARYDYEAHFGSFPAGIEDDHIPFREAAIPALELIDFSYGGSQLDHKKNWHTAEDRLDKLCPGSLRAVGDVIYHAIVVIDGQLDTIGTATDGQ